MISGKKKRCLYLYGPRCVGKSTCAEPQINLCLQAVTRDKHRQLAETVDKIRGNPGKALGKFYEHW